MNKNWVLAKHVSTENCTALVMSQDKKSAKLATLQKRNIQK
jgi:hypothetical protein